MENGDLENKPLDELNYKQRILAKIERLEHEAKKLQRNASAYYHWNDTSIFRHQSRVQPADMGGPINRINKEIEELKAQLKQMEESK